jgi:hypothetical protein
MDISPHTEKAKTRWFLPDKIVKWTLDEFKDNFAKRGNYRFIRNRIAYTFSNPLQLELLNIVANGRAIVKIF